MILLTGGTGFVGGHLADELLKDSVRIRCLVRDPEKAGRLAAAGCEIVRGDVLDPSSILNAITPEIDAVVHLVGILAESKGSTFKSIHATGTRNVVASCIVKGVKKYLHMSALGTRSGARSEYHKTKWEAEEIVRASGLDYSIFRPAVIFGPGDAFTNVFAKIMKVSPVVFIPGDGKSMMQPVFVKDVARAFASALKGPAACGRVYELAGPDTYTFDSIIDRIAFVLGKKRYKVHIPMRVMRLNAAVAEKIFTKPPVSRDALIMLEEDNVTKKRDLEEAFGIKPTLFIDGMRTYLN
ncbi:MAG TPA: complex I NDUFA9 subunit family protein [Thermodesulfobacteriota bacterium]|nr:complex I NDUFA9 subunit family protein [Thermodesulfobacteriota bacterium]